MKILYNAEEGYGIECSLVKWKSDVKEIIINELIPQTTEIARRLGQWKLDKKKHKDYEGMSEEEFDEAINDLFVEGYAYTFNHTAGMEVLIADIINEIESLDVEITAFHFNDDCLYVPASIPINDYDKEKFLTQVRIDEILSKYMSLLADEPAEIKWHKIRDYE